MKLQDYSVALSAGHRLMFVKATSAAEAAEIGARGLGAPNEWSVCVLVYADGKKTRVRKFQVTLSATAREVPQ